MKKILFLIYLLLLCSFLFAKNDTNNISQQVIRLQFQEFAYPFIPDASKILVEVPLSLIDKNAFLSRTNTRIWYLTASPFFVPDPFYEIGFTAEYNLSHKDKSSFSIGMGSAFSQDNGIISIPLIISIRKKWFPLNWMDIQASLENLLYGEGDIMDIHLTSSFKPFNSGLLFQIGGTGTLALGWTQNIIAYSYGLSAGLGYLF